MLARIKNKFNRHKYALTSVSFLSLGNVFTAGVGLLITVVLANHLSVNDFGNYKYVYSVVGILGIFNLTGGYRNVVLQSASRGMDGAALHVHKKKFLFGAPMIVSSFILSIYYFYHDNYFLSFSILIISICTLFYTDGLISSAYLNGKKEYKKLFFATAVVSLTNFISIFVAVFLEKSLLVIISINTMSIALMSVASFYYVKNNFFTNSSIDKKILHYGKHLNVLGILSTIMQYIDSVLIFSLLGSQSLALFAIATPFVDRIIGFFKILYFYFLPRYTEHGSVKSKDGLYKRSFYLFLFGLLIYGVYLVIAPFIIPVIFPKYSESVGLSLLFALNIPFHAASILPAAYLDSLIEVRKKYMIQAVNFTVRIVTILVFIKMYGIVGVIWSEILTRIISFCAVFIIINTRKNGTREHAVSSVDF